MEIGSIISSMKDGEFKVIEYVGKGRFLVRFLSTGYVTTAQRTKVKQGQVRDHLKPIKFGVGFLGEMAGKTRRDSITRKSYQTWHNMLTRCYYKPYHDKFPTYKDCTVCDDWLNFSNFNNWFLDNYEEGLVLDKDIIKTGNKIYCPELCKFVKPEENGLAAKISVMRSYKVLSPEGQETVIYNVTKFCKEKDFSQGTFALMLNGTRQSAWGWKLIEEIKQ